MLSDCAGWRPAGDGVDIAYATYGAGDGAGGTAVVLVHGWAGNRACRAHEIDYLAERYQVIAIDLGGRGDSGLGRLDWNLAAFGDDVVAVVDEVGAHRIVLVGHSMGGDAVVHAARRLGDRVVGLVWSTCSDRSATKRCPHRKRSRPSSAPFARTLRPRSIDSCANFFRRPSTAGSSIASRPTWPPLPERSRSARWPMRATASPGCSLRRHGVEPVLVEDVGHFPMIEAPDRFNAVLGAALASFGS